MAQAAQLPPDHIRIGVDSEIAKIPVFHGNYKDTDTLISYIGRIDQGVSHLGWSQETAFTFFSNSVKGRARAWLQCYQTDNPQLPKTWQDFKPCFRKAFGDFTDPIVFANELCNIRPEQHGNCLYTYYEQITNAVNLHQEKFITPPPQPQLPNELDFDEEQVVFVQNLYVQTHKNSVLAIHTQLRKEFFLNGLSKKHLDLVANKPHLQTVNDMIEYIHLQESVEKKKNGGGTLSSHNTPTVQAVIAPTPPPENEEMAAFTTTTSNRGQTFRGTTYRGNNYRGNNYTSYRGTSNRGFDIARGGYRQNQNQNTGQNQNFQNAGQKQTTGPSKTCIYCRRVGHIQDFCRDRMNKGDPCISSQGNSYYPNPKINVHSTNVFGEPIISKIDSAAATTPSTNTNSVFFLEN